MYGDIHNLESIYYVIGFIVVTAYAWQRFDEPSFPNQETLPHVVEPLRYLFLGPTYRRARLTYVFFSLLLYSLLVLPGPGIVKALAPLGATDANFPIQVWALMVALFLVGVAPNSNIQWLTMIEARLRRFVHSFFLVPDGALRTIAVLDDARYTPPQWLCEAVGDPAKSRLLADLKLGAAQPEYRWARATMILESLKQRGGDANPLKRSAFAPFDKDFEDIRRAYRLLEPEVERLRSAGSGTGEEDRAGTDNAQPSRGDAADMGRRREELSSAISLLLKQMYAYVNWGIRQQASSEKDVTQVLEDLGFHLPVIGKRRLFDVVFPTILLVALWSFVWAILTLELFSRKSVTLSSILISALCSATAAACMYGFAISSALNRRSAKIEDRVWVQSSPRCFVSISIVAGLVSWLVIVASTIFWSPADTISSMIGLWNLVRSIGAEAGGKWLFLPAKITTALPWVVAGGTASAVLAYLLGGDVRRAGWKGQLRDAAILCVALGFAAAFAQGIQSSLDDMIQTKWPQDGVEGLTNAALMIKCVIQGFGEAVTGFIIGFVVPYAFRRNIVFPNNPVNARELRKISALAHRAFPDDAAASDWIFKPSYDLGEITPAEAIQYKTLVNRVPHLLEGDTLHPHQILEPPIPASPPSNLLRLRQTARRD